MNSDKNNNSKLKIISAIIALILGLILAIGYPTGGVKAHKNTQYRVTRMNNHVTHTQNANTHKALVKKEKPKKKRIVTVTPPQNTEESDDEGC